MRRHRNSCTGFTLSEMLVLMVIVAIAAVLLFSGLSSARDRAVSLQCLSQLQQTGLALQVYSAEHGGLIPPRLQADPAQPGVYIEQSYWHRTLRNGGYLPNVADAKGIQFCPGFKSPADGMEAYGMRRWKTPGQAMDVSQNIRKLPAPADFFILVDSYFTGRASQGYFVQGGDAQWNIRFTHGNRANTLFADGHVAAMDRAYFQGLPERQSDYSGTLAYQLWPAQP